MQGIRLSTLSKGKFDITTLHSIVKIVRNEGADVLHLHGYGASNFGLLCARLTGVKTVVHEHFVDPNIPGYQIPLDFALGRFADHAIAVSESVKEFMIRKRYLPESKVEVLYNGAPLDDFKPQDEDTIKIQRKYWKIPDDAKVIATIGRLDTQKGHKYFIEAASILLEQRRNLKFLIVGDGPLMESLKVLSREKGIDEDIIFTGYCPNIPLVQSMIDIQAFPSLWEGTPLTAFEAMSMKLPIVSTDVDGLGEVLKNDINALIVPSRDSQALADKITILLDDEAIARKLSRNAYLGSKNYDICKSVRRMEEIYDCLVQSKK
jgi:glycosyltransferase involved in cell wall biosynthesis